MSAMNRGVCARGWVVSGGGWQHYVQLRIFDQRLHPSTSPLLLHESPLRLIKLDQDDTNNWLKLGPVRRPNDPYLTPFVAMVSLFPRRAPFGTVYLGSATSVLAQSPAEHNSSLTSWERRKGYIFCRCLVRHFTPFLHCPPGETQREKADEVFWCEMLPFDINIHDLREEK